MIDLNEAIGGGISDPRNSTLIKMFSLINIGERAGSGLPMIYKAWADSDYAMPDISEKENPDRVCFTLPVECLEINAECPNKSDKETNNVLINEQSQEQEQTKENLLIALLIGQPNITQKIMAKKLNLTDRSVRRIISDLQKQGKLKRIGSNKKGQWLVVESK